MRDCAESKWERMHHTYGLQNPKFRGQQYEGSEPIFRGPRKHYFDLSYRPQEAPYKVYPPKFQNFALKGAICDKGHHVSAKYSIFRLFFESFADSRNLESHVLKSFHGCFLSE